MVNALDSESSGPCSRPGRGHCVVFMGKTLDYHSACSPPMQVYKWVPANLILGVTLLVAACYRNQDKLRPDGPLGSYADFYLFLIRRASYNNT